MKFDRYFSKAGQSPYDAFTWGKRTAEIKRMSGEVIFRQDGVEFPDQYSDQAVNIVASKYFHGDKDKVGVPVEQGGRETSLRQLISRVCDTIADWGVEGGYFTKEEGEVYRDELTALTLDQYGAFNSPVWFNVGLFQKYGLKGSRNGWRWDRELGRAVECESSYEHPQGSACLPGSAMVNTTKGLVPIKDIVDQVNAGELVETYDQLGNPNKVIAGVYNGKRDLLKLTLENGVERYMTDDHFVFIGETQSDGSRPFAEVSAFRLEVGDAMFYSDSAKPCVAAKVLDGDILPPYGEAGPDEAKLIRVVEKTEDDSLKDIDVYDIQTESGVFWYDGLLVHNCFIVSVPDDLGGIMDVAKTEAMLFKYGSGVGESLSTLRSTREKLSGGGRPSGPLSFFKVLDTVASVVKSGGVCLAPDQPVYTAAGCRTAKELADANKPFTVLSYSKRLGRVAAKRAHAWQSTEKKVVCVTTDKGTFHVSYDHPFMLKTGEVKRAYELTPGLRLMAVTTQPSRNGYARVGLLDGKKGRSFIHRMVANDLMPGFDPKLILHHIDHNKMNNEPDNLAFMESQTEHANLHSAKLVAAGEHVFQNRSFPKPGNQNGMHASSQFWNDTKKVENYARKQRDILVRRGDAASMQKMSMRQQMLNTGYSLINAGHEINNFEKYVTARKLAGRRCFSKLGQQKIFEKNFGSYENYYAELGRQNHQVVSVTELGVMPVYSVEVEDDEPDDKRPWSEHNYVIAPIGSTGSYIHGCTCLNTRRAARMQILHDWHPDVIEFANAKAAEEKKAHALIKGGYDSDYNGEAYGSVQFQNTNTSLRLSDAFLAQVEADGPWTTKTVVGQKDCETWPANRLMDAVAEGTWFCGDPGVQYEDTIQHWHTVPNHSACHASNPCAEYLHIDNSACNLFAINLLRFLREDGTFDLEGYRAAVKIAITAQEIIVSNANYPTQIIAENSHNLRPLGLGYASLGATLMCMGLPYDSDEGRDFAGALTAIMHGQAYLTSSHHAAEHGAFHYYESNKEPMMRVIRQHQAKVPSRGVCDLTESIWDEARELWKEVVASGEKNGFRNSQATVIMPTGTCAFMMDAPSTGPEPFIALVSYKNLAGGGMMKLVNPIVPRALRTLLYNESDIDMILKHIEANDTIEGCDILNPEHLPVFDCAFKAHNGTRFLSFTAHVDMMAAIQPFISGAISKTCNVPESATVEDIKAAYLYAWKRGIKALAIYRDNSKGSQPLSMTAEGAEKTTENAADHAEIEALKAKVAELQAEVRKRCEPIRMPETRDARTHKFSVDGHDGYITAGYYEDGKLGELFIKMSKEGSTIGGLMDVFSIAVSIGLQHGAPLDRFVDKFEYTRFAPAGFTKNTDIRQATSVVDYVFRWLNMEFPGGVLKRKAGVPIEAPAEPPIIVSLKTGTSNEKVCQNCGGMLVRDGKCMKCMTCGVGGGCGE
jgi:adenosylcobalamin-dependent ribonucleoside-diphosphate reductase